MIQSTNILGKFDEEQRLQQDGETSYLSNSAENDKHKHILNKTYITRTNSIK